MLLMNVILFHRSKLNWFNSKRFIATELKKNRDLFLLWFSLISKFYGVNFPLNWKTENCCCSQKTQAWNGKIGNNSVWTKSKLRAGVQYELHRNVSCAISSYSCRQQFSFVCRLSCSSFFLSFFLNQRLEWINSCCVSFGRFWFDNERKQIFFRAFEYFPLNNHNCFWMTSCIIWKW